MVAASDHRGFPNVFATTDVGSAMIAVARSAFAAGGITRLTRPSSLSGRPM